MTARAYPNPPIQEALVDFRFSNHGHWNWTYPGRYWEIVRDEYDGPPRSEQTIAVNAQQQARALSTRAVAGVGRVFRVRKVAKYIGNRAEGLGRTLDSLEARLKEVTEEAGGDAVVEATVRAYQASLQVARGGPAWDRRARREELNKATLLLLDVTDRDPDCPRRAVGLVMPQLAHRYRASSAIENLNSVLRPYLVVQKHAEQGFLHLFQFYWNTRTRQWGRCKGTSAHDQLTGHKVEDWLAILGFHPSETFAAAA